MSEESKKLIAMLRGLNDVAETRDNYVRVPINYPGGKTKSLGNLLQVLPYRRVFVDALAGCGAVLLARHESELEYFNDCHAGIVSFFRAIRQVDTCKRLVDRLEMTLCSREEFIWSRDTWQHDVMDDVERAARWYYAVQHSFSGKGWSFGRTLSGKPQGMKVHNNLQLFWPIHHRMKRVYIENMDYRVLTNDLNTDKNGDDIVWYLDPPYWETDPVYEHNFKEADHYELGERCMKLNGYIAVSGYDSPKHPYNTFKWDKKEQWEVDVKMLGMSYTETNHLIGMEDQLKRGKVIETVWIRDTAR